MNKASIVRVQKYLLIPQMVQASKHMNTMYDRIPYFRTRFLKAGFIRLALENSAWIPVHSGIDLNLRKFPKLMRLFGRPTVTLSVFLSGAWGIRIDADVRSLRMRQIALEQITEMEAMKGQLFRMHRWHYIGGFSWDPATQQVYYTLNSGNGYELYKDGNFPVSEFRKALNNEGRILLKNR